MIVKNLGDILIEQGIIDRDALNRALHIQNRRLGDILIEENLADPVAIANALKLQARAAGNRRSNRICIDARALEDLLNRLEAVEGQVAGLLQGVPALMSLGSLRQTVEQLLLEPVESLFHKAKWAALQGARELGKQVEIVFEGEGLVIDRSLADDLSDMMLHLVRNGVDHGIEPPDLRLRMGKRSSGTLVIRIELSAGRLILTVTDDGQGIDEERIYARAFELGLIKQSRSEVLRDELYRVLFTPGFSTNESVTSMSGRGVGLDVVEASAIRLGGDVHVESLSGIGATFTVNVPLRSARLPVIPLRVGVEWIAVTSSEISKIEETTDFNSLLSAASLFSGNPSSAAEKSLDTFSRQPVLSVVAIGGSRWVFDEIGQPEFVMVREAPALAKGSRGVVGGARMQDGRNILIVDLNLLASIATRVFEL